MTTLVVITSPISNVHRVRVELKQGGRVTAEELLDPGQSADMHVWGLNEIVVTETMEKSLDEKAA